MLSQLDRQASQQPLLLSLGAPSPFSYFLFSLLSLTLRLTFPSTPYSSSSTRPTPPSSTPLSLTHTRRFNSHPYTHTHTTNTHYSDNHRQPSLTPWTCHRQSVKSTPRYSQVSTPSTATSPVITSFRRKMHSLWTSSRTQSKGAKRTTSSSSLTYHLAFSFKSSST